MKGNGGDVKKTDDTNSMLLKIKTGTGTTNSHRNYEFIYWALTRGEDGFGKIAFECFSVHIGSRNEGTEISKLIKKLHFYQ